MRDAKIPQTVRQLISFLGTANVYKRFVPNYAKIAARLYNSLKNLPSTDAKKPETPIEMNEEADDGFCKLKDALCFATILAILIEGRKISIDTGASNCRNSCAPHQEQEDEKRSPFGYFRDCLIDLNAINRKQKDNVSH